MNLECRGIAQEKPVFFDTTYRYETTEKDIWKRKEDTRSAIPNDPPVITVSCYRANDLQKETTIVNKAELTKPSPRLLEQDSDSTKLNFKRHMLGLLFDEQVLISDAGYMCYS